MRYCIAVYPIRIVQFIPTSICTSCLHFFLLLFILLTPAPLQTAGQAALLQVQGAIDPAISDYLQKGFKKSEELQAAVVIIQLDTPGRTDIITESRT